MKERVVLAYSGSPVASAAVRQLVEEGRFDVVTLTLDLGARGELQEIQERSLALGAVRAHVIDAREEFADAHLLPALQAGAFDGRPETISALARPLIARKLVEIARIERATAVAHAAPAASGLDTLIRAIDPAIQILDVAAASTDVRHPTVSPHGHDAPHRKPSVADNGADVEITFDRDVPVAINGVPMSLIELIESLTVIAVQHGVTAAGDFAGAPALVVLQAAFNARPRDEVTSVVRLKLQHGLTSATASPGPELAVRRS